jgi:5-methylcytosine-specific restriction endonuclease McrA
VSITEAVRQRAGFACEWCTVSETDTGGELTIDHYQPQSKQGSDEWSNLLYSCNCCNEYKADYWLAQANDPVLWNPRQEPRSNHLLPLANGTLYPITPVGAFSFRSPALRSALSSA